MEVTGMDWKLWSQTYGMDHKPTWAQITDFVSHSNWTALTGWIRDHYGVEPLIEYSKEMSAWNVKYKKTGKSLCTIYPEPGIFTVLVVVPPKLEPLPEPYIASLSKKTQEIYRRTAAMAIGRWLMIPVDAQAQVDDVQKLIALRVPPKGTK
jgi:hypothetical protein